MQKTNSVIEHVEEEPLTDHDVVVPPSTLELAGSLTAVILPFIGFIAACVLLWDQGASWVNLSMLLVGYVLTGFGITVGYHRLFTHKSFKTSTPITVALGVLGSMAVQGSILEWVATHRRHHQHSDHEDDPHSPHHHGTSLLAWFHGFYHAHIGWFFSSAPNKEFMDRYVPDLQADPVTRTVSKLFPLWVLLGAVIPALIGYIATGTWYGALTGFIWGGLLRVFLVHHVTWSVNSVCHIWGAHTYNTHDRSKNNPIFGVLAFGEGWHNNHHAFPTSARHGLEWWQFDSSYMVIRALSLVGLASEVKLPPRERMEAKRMRPAAPAHAEPARADPPSPSHPVVLPIPVVVPVAGKPASRT